MQWKNLQQNKCPNCSRSLLDAYDTATDMFVCRGKDCDFKITQQRFKEIVADKNFKGIQDPPKY